MKTERTIATRVSIDSEGSTKTNTSVTETRKSHAFTASDLERTKENEMLTEVGKAGLDLTVLAGANIWAYEQIIDGFHHGSILKIGAAVLVYGATARFAVPAFKHHLREAAVARREKREIKNTIAKSTKPATK